MAWLVLVVAGCFEVAWSFMMKQSTGFTLLGPSLLAVAFMLVSFGLLAVAMRSLPLGTAYAVWTGIGAVGAFVMGVLVLGEPASPIRLVAVLLIAAGIVLMQRAQA